MSDQSEHHVFVDGEIGDLNSDNWITISIREVNWANDWFSHNISPTTWVGDYDKDLLKMEYVAWQNNDQERRMPWSDGIYDNVTRALKSFFESRKITE